MTAAMHDAPLLRVLRDPSSAASLDWVEWVDLVGSARHANLLSRLCWLLDRAPGVDALPERARVQLRAARPVADHHERMIRWEVERIGYALRGLQTRIVLVKGAAYVMAGLPAGHGRLATDVDILVAKRDIRSAETALMAAGWEAVKLHPYQSALLPRVGARTAAPQACHPTHRHRRASQHPAGERTPPSGCGRAARGCCAARTLGSQ